MGRLKALDPFLHGVIEETYEDGPDIIKRIASLISNKIQPPYSIAIEGPWGEGKTTLLMLLKEELESQKYPTLWFNPWEYEGQEDVLLALQQHLAMSFVSKFKLAKKNIGIFALSLLVGGVDAVAQSLTGKIVSYKNIKGIVDDIDEVFCGDPTTEYIDIVKCLKDDFVKITQQISVKKDYEDKPLVILIDDLDRCLPENSVALLEALKNFYVVKDANVIVVTGVDIGVASSFIKQKYKGMETEHAIQYFRKIFNLTLKVPQKNKTKVNKYIKSYIEELYTESDGTQEDGYKCAHDISTTVTKLMNATKTRSIRQVLNVVNNFYAIEQLKDENTTLNNSHILALLFMKELWYEQYHEMLMEMKKFDSGVTFDKHLSEHICKEYSKGNSDLEKYIWDHLRYKIELRVLRDAGML